MSFFMKAINNFFFFALGKYKRIEEKTQNNNKAKKQMEPRHRQKLKNNF